MNREREETPTEREKSGAQEEAQEKEEKRPRVENTETGEKEGTEAIDGAVVPERLRGHVVRVDACRVALRKGLARDMRVEGLVYANAALLPQMLAECAEAQASFVGALLQVANVASVPGVLGRSLAMPDAHSGYGFSIGGVAAVDAADPAACVCPGGVGYDINCGVSLLRTNLDAATALATPAQRERLAAALFARIPVGVGCETATPAFSHQQSSSSSKSSGGGGGGGKSADALPREVLTRGLPWLVEQGRAWPEDVAHCEEGGCVAGADPACVSRRALARGRLQLGTLGSGNHYVEVQAVDEVYDAAAAAAMGLDAVGRVCVMVHSGSRGLGHQVCSDALRSMQHCADAVHNANDEQLTGVPVQSRAGQDYLHAMACAANYAFVNRGCMRQCVREAFVDTFARDSSAIATTTTEGATGEAAEAAGAGAEEMDAKRIEEEARKMDMHLVYDVCHNLAKFEDHVVDGRAVHCLVHRKGATRAFPPGHPDVPACYRAVGQPVIIGGSMGTCSYVLTGTAQAMAETFGSTCHGAGRALSRSTARRTLPAADVMQGLAERGIVLKIATPKDVAEEAAEAYKDVSQVVQTCHDAGISKLCVRLRPLIVCKG